MKAPLSVSRTARGKGQIKQCFSPINSHFSAQLLFFFCGFWLQKGPRALDGWTEESGDGHPSSLPSAASTVKKFVKRSLKTGRRQTAN